MGILRGVNKGLIKPLAESIISSGLKTIEITMNTEGAHELIKGMKKISGEQLTIGAGTVLNLSDLKKALGSGATFIVSPVLINEIVQYCVKNKIPVFPGALTPQEIYSAWKAGATMVKVFPAKFFGPSYFKEIKAPLNEIELLACGGVNPSTISGFFDCGASAVAFGSSVFKKELLLEKKFSQIENNIKSLIKSFRNGSQNL